MFYASDNWCTWRNCWIFVVKIRHKLNGKCHYVDTESVSSFFHMDSCLCFSTDNLFDNHASGIDCIDFNEVIVIKFRNIR